MKTALLLLTMASLASCAPFVRTDSQGWEIGVGGTWEQAEAFAFNLFSKQESLSLVNEK